MEEEVQRVFDALDGLAGIDDPKTRALAVAKVLGAWSKQASRLREMRRQAVLELLKPEGATVRSVAKELGVSPTTVQDIKTSYSRSGRDREKKTGTEE